jgi:hydroxyethylthiazole kinase-like sugar kinase family protein
MCIYDVADPGRDLILPVDLLRSVSGSGSSLSAAESAVLSFDKTQYKSVTAIERLSLYAEDAAARAATQSIGSGKLIAGCGKLNSAAVSVQAPLSL